MRRTSQCAIGNYARAPGGCTSDGRRTLAGTAAHRAVVEAELHATLIRHTEQADRGRANQIERRPRTGRSSGASARGAAGGAERDATTWRRADQQRRRRLKQLAQWGGYRESRRGAAAYGVDALDEVERLSRQNEELLLDNQSPPAAARRRGGDDAAAEERALGDAFLGRAAEHLRLQGTSDELLAEAELLWGAERD